MNQEIEKELFSQFIAANRKDRFFWHIESKKRREKIFNDLRDTRYFNESKCKEVESPEDIVNYFKLKTKAKKLYIISSEEEFDGKEISLSELEENEFWQSNEIIGYDTKSKKGFFVNHESWFYLLG